MSRDQTIEVTKYRVQVTRNDIVIAEWLDESYDAIDARYAALADPWKGCIKRLQIRASGKIRFRTVSEEIVK